MEADLTVCFAKIIEIENMGPRAVRVRLQPENPSFSFLAGQWIDLGVSVDDEEDVAGYSPASSPNDPAGFDLGIRLSHNNKVSQWFHNRKSMDS